MHKIVNQDILPNQDKDIRLKLTLQFNDSQVKS